jgi:hypothetical protein
MIEGHAYFNLCKQSERTQSIAAQAPLIALHGSADDRRGLALIITEETERLVALLNSAEASAPRGNLDPPSQQTGDGDEEDFPPDIRSGV